MRITRDKKQLFFHPTKVYTCVVVPVDGGANPIPGEISLAHNGVLFLDEIVNIPILVSHLSEAIGYRSLDSASYGTTF